MNEKKCIADVVSELLKKLREKGIGCYIWHRATTGSIYVRFDDNRIGSVRIGDHEGKGRYKYKFNIRGDITESHSIVDNNIARHFYPYDAVDSCVEDIIKRSLIVQGWKNCRYKYGTPSWKR